MATGLLRMGSRTTTAAITQLLPYPVLPGPAAEPSWNHDAAQAFFPRRLKNVRNDGGAKNGASPAIGVISDAGTGSVASASIGGNPFHRRFHKHRRCSPLPRRHPPHWLNQQVTRRVAGAASRISRAGSGTP